MQVQVRLRFLAEDLHLVLIETLLRAELQLGGAVLEVHVAHRMADVLAPVAGLGLLEGCPPALREAGLGAVAGSIGAGQVIRCILGDGTMAPAAVAEVCGGLRDRVRDYYFVYTYFISRNLYLNK